MVMHEMVSNLGIIVVLRDSAVLDIDPCVGQGSIESDQCTPWAPCHVNII